jgi:effector-binding domain-containing protein
MQIKTVKPINFLFFQTETTVQQLINFLPVGQQLIKEAVAYGIPVTGPVHWHYFGFTGDERKSFRLEISLPVGEIVEEYDGEFHFKRTDSFRCVSLTHEGGWMQIPDSYGKVFAFLAANNLTPAAVNREVYVNVDMKDMDANVTEIQIGIQ